MTKRSTVAVLRTRPETVLQDYQRLLELAGYREYLAPGTSTILKDNISWHFPFPAANTTPWQLEGTVLGLQAGGYDDVVCVQNKTVVTNAFKGEDLNNYVPIFRQYDIPVLFNFREEDIRWIPFQPKGEMLVLPQIYPEGIYIPEYFVGKNIVHLPTVKCVDGDTEIVLADGSITHIRDVVAMQLAKAPSVLLEADGEQRAQGTVDLLAMSPDGKVKPHTARWVWRTARNGRRLFRVRTRTGRTLVATEDHLIHTPSGWTALGGLRAGSRIAVARRLKVHGESQPLPRTQSTQEAPRVVARPGRKYSAVFAQEVIDTYCAGTTATAIAEQSGIPWQAVQAILTRHDVPLRRNVTQLRVPERTSREFWRWFGYVMAEGCVERGESTDKLWWVNAEPAIREDFKRLTAELFGCEAKEHADGRNLHVYSKRLGSFLEELGLPVPLHAGNKRVPELLFRCPDEEIAAFLSAYLDGDGSVSSRQAEVSATTKSEELARGLQILFARLGAVAFHRTVERIIPGKWEHARTYHQVTVSGEGAALVAEHLQLRHSGKQRALKEQAQRFLAGKQPSNWDTVPLPAHVFRAVREGLGLTQMATGKPSSVNNIERGYGQPTPRIARYFVNLFEQYDREGRFAGEIERLRALSSEDLAWDIVQAIEEVPGDAIDLYDVTVPGAESFVANGLVVHNCHIYTTTTGAMKNAFGGLLNTHRHYTHSWIHETLVDLLTIQKEIHSGIFAVMDGTTVGSGAGPRTMTPHVKNLILASGDQVAIDAVAAKLMGFDPLSLKYIRLAHDRGLGTGDPREIELVGDDVSRENWHFKVGDNGASLVGDLLWFGPLSRLQKLFFRTPLVNVFIFGSETYHDYYHWPLKGRRTFETWQRSTPWGQMFSQYRERGHLGGETRPLVETQV